MNNLLFKTRSFTIFLLDIVIGFISLFIMVLARYGVEDFYTQFYNHLPIFSIIILLFILVFYIFNLYSFRFNRNITEFSDSFIKSIILTFSLSIIIFYILGDSLKLSPKTNLIIFTAVFGSLDFYIRIITRRYYVKKRINRKIIIINNEPSNLVKEIEDNQNIGYEVIGHLPSFDLNKILSLKPDIIVTDLKNDNDALYMYTLLRNNIALYTINAFYEETFQKVPTENMEKSRMIEYASKTKSLFIFLKRIMDITMSIGFLIITIPFSLVISILIKITSKGPILFKQTRISLNEEKFTIYKFRSMYIDSEKDGAVWTKDDKIDSRITPIGRILRKTHLDEIPQLINIIKGDISFVGPRPERPEFIEVLDKEIVYYNLRHCVKAGLTGWAQINYRYGSSIDDTREKLKYDFYYIKNRNIFLDILIIMKTVAMIFQKH